MSAAEGALLALMVDSDTATGMLLTGVGHVDLRKRANFLIVDDSECAGAACRSWGTGGGGRRFGCLRRALAARSLVACDVGSRSPLHPPLARCLAASRPTTITQRRPSRG